MAAIAAGSAGSLVDPTGAPVPGAQKQRKKSKFRLKERSSSSVREKFINDPAYTEDVRHLALPMRRNSGPEHDPGRKFYMISKKKSNSVGKDYSRGSGSLHIGGTGVSEDFYTLDVESIRRAGLNVPEVKPRRKKYNHHTSAELLNRLLNTDESSSSDALPAKATTLDRARGRSLDRRSYVTTAASVDDAGAAEQQQQRGSRKNRNPTRRQTIERDVVPIPIEPLEDPAHPEEAKAGDREAGASKGGRFQIGKRFLKGEIGIKSFNYYLLKEGLKSSKKNLLKQRSAPVAPVADGQQSAALPDPPPAAGMDAGSPPEQRVPPDEVHRPAAKCEENIYEEIYFEDRPKAQGMYLKDVPQQDPSTVREANDEKIQFIDCELCVQQCSNASCDLCHGRAAQHTAQQHEHHHHQLQQQRQAEQKQQNIYEQLKQHGSGGSSAGSGSGTGLTSRTKASKSLDMDELYQRNQKQQLQAQQSRQKQPQQQRQGYVGSVEDLNGAASALYASRNVLQYQSYNPSNPNVYKLETTPVAFSSDYSPLQQIYYKPQPPPGGPPGGGQDPAGQHIYQKPLHQKPGNVSGSGSDYYQELAGTRKKSSSSSDSLHQRRLQRDQPLYHRSTTGVYQQRAPPLEEQMVVGPPPSSGVGAKLYKVSSNASILSEASGRSDGSYRQQLQQQQQHQLQAAQQPHLTHPSIRAEVPPAGGQPAGQPYGRTGGNMSDSSLGDSLFSYPANRRYFGSSESCRFASESCRRCSVEVDKCSFSDTCRYSDCRNCDCSSSYFSSDFDDTATHGGSRSKSGSRASHAPDPAAGYYAAPPYAEDFMKHVSAVKRGSQPQQPVAAGTHVMAGGKIYETPSTYVGMMPSSSLLKGREPTYETLRNPPYSIPMVGVPSGDALGMGSLSAARQSISQSHEALLSPTRRSRSSRSTDTEQYPYAERRSPSPHYSKIRRPHQSSTLPSSVRSGRRQQQQQYSDTGGYSVIREAPGTMAGGSTLPKSFSMQQPQPAVPLAVGGRSSSLLAMGHEYAEISKPGGKDARKPIPPPISTIPTHRDGRTGGSMGRGKPKPAARSASPAKYGRTGRVEVEVSNVAEVTATVERKSRERTLKLKAGDQTGDTPTKRDRSPATVAPKPVATAQEKGTRVRKEPATGSGTLPGRTTTGSTRRREFVKSREQQQHQQQRGKRRVAQDFSDDGEEDDDDDEVFLSDKVYERPGVGNRGPPETGPSAKGLSGAPSATTTSTTPQTTVASGPVATTIVSTTTTTTTAAATTTTTTIESAVVAHRAPGSSVAGQQAFDFTLQPPTSSSSSSGTQPHSSTSGGPPVTDHSPIRKSKQKPESDAAPATGTAPPLSASGSATQPNESENLRTTTDHAGSKAPAGTVSDPASDAGRWAPPALSGSGSKTTTIALSSESDVAGDRSRRDGPVVPRQAADAPNRSKEQLPVGQQGSEAAEGNPADTTGNAATGQPGEQRDEPASDEYGTATGQDECDIIDFPLPEIPVSGRQDPTSSDSFLTATDAEDGTFDGVRPLESEQRTNERKRATRGAPDLTEVERPEKDPPASMHYRTSANGGKPTYLFGENLKKNEIFLNKSGWVQVSGQPAPGLATGRTSYQFGGGSASGNVVAPLDGSKVSRKYIVYDENRYTGRPGQGTKLEDLINRNESRGKGTVAPRSASQQLLQKVQRQDNVTILKIDPSASTTLSNRPACLSIKRNLIDGSPPPVTPILSPPPAFQDSQQQQQQQQQQAQSNKTRLGDIKPGTRIFLSVVDNENHNPKGMVFSRSFEYDRRLNRRPPDQNDRTGVGYGPGAPGGSVDAFSKSFDYDFNPPGAATGSQPPKQPQSSQQQQQQPLKSSLIRRTRSPTFATLTGNSPNYLTKKEKPPTLSSPIFPKAIPGNSLTVNRAVLGYASSESLRKFDKNKSLDGGGLALGHRSRRSQFSTKANSAPGLPYGFRSDSVGNQRLNSCDSGARSDYSNDDVDDDDDDDEDEEISEDQSSSLALSYKSSTSYINQMKGWATGFGGGSPSQSQGAMLSATGAPGAHTFLKVQRSLTPERLYDNNDDYGSARNLKKQRSLTPEKRSRTPDDRSKRKGDPSNSSQSSLVSRQSSGSRSSTLERQQLRYDEGFMRTSSRSSSSSSYSREENVPATSPSNSYRRNQQQRGGIVRIQPAMSLGLGGDYKIRRSRSLQLSERSPSRQQIPVQQQPVPHKVVVRLGTIPPKQQPAYATAAIAASAGRKQGPLPQMLSQDSLMGGGGLVYSRISPSSTLDRLRRETASNTLDVVDKSKSFDNNNSYGLGSGSLASVTGLPYESYGEFDKSKSFDDNLGLGPADRITDKRTYVTNEKRSYSHDRVFSSTGTSSSNNTSQSSTSRQRSPQTSLFGGLNRGLYEPELPYELSRVTMARSPIMMGSGGYRATAGHHRGLVARERSPVPAPGTGIRYQQPTDLYLMRQQTPDSEYDSERLTPEYGTGEPTVAPITTFKEAELVKKFLYATKNKVQLHRESMAGRSAVAAPSSAVAGTPSSGSCTASSCDFWPHCGVSSAGATTASAQLQVTEPQEQSQRDQHAQQLPKSGSENCLSRKVVKRTAGPAADSHGPAGNCVGGTRASGLGGGSVSAGPGGSGGGGLGGGGYSSSNSSHASHISNSTGSTILWSGTSKGSGSGNDGPGTGSSPSSRVRTSTTDHHHRAMPVPIKANSYGGVSSYGQHQQPKQPPQQRVLRKQQNFEFYDDDGAGPLAYRMSSGPVTAGRATGSPNGGLTVEQGHCGPSSSIISTIIKANSITFLGEHEMPITRDRASTATGGKGKPPSNQVQVVAVGGGCGGSTASGALVTGGWSATVPNASSTTTTVAVTNAKVNRGSSSSGGSIRQQQKHPAEPHGKAGNERREGRASRSGSGRSKGGTVAPHPAGLIKRKVEMKLKSRSLPKSFMRYR